MPFNRNSDERGSGGIFRVLIGTGIGVAAALVLALIMTCAALSARDPAALLLPLSMAALIIGAVVSGALSSVGGGAVSGLLGGALYVLVFWVISLFFRGGRREGVRCSADASRIFRVSSCGVSRRSRRLARGKTEGKGQCPERREKSRGNGERKSRPRKKAEIIKGQPRDAVRC